MPSITELRQYIRFQLSLLRPQNQHHLFEDLCRQLARLTICERVIPATGPVAGTGDQGRDFETYRTYHSSTPIAKSTFLGMGQSKTIVFACTTQQSDISSKIRSDIKTICKASSRPDAIYYFTEIELKVADRHKLQEWCLEEFSIPLEVLDGQAITEQLCNIDLFWIAKEYLSIPAEMFPVDTQFSSSYSDYKSRWLGSERTPFSYSDFCEIKYWLRQSTFNRELKPDLSDWSNKMQVFVDSSAEGGLRSFRNFR